MAALYQNEYMQLLQIKNGCGKNSTCGTWAISVRERVIDAKHQRRKTPSSFK
jgi:hypothetical protein